MATTYYTVWTPVKGILHWIEWDNYYRLTPHKVEAYEFVNGMDIEQALAKLNLCLDQVHIFKYTVTEEYLENPDLDKLD